MKPHRALSRAHLFGLLLVASALVSCALAGSGSSDQKQAKKQLEESQARKDSAALAKSLESAANSVNSEKSRQVSLSDASAAQPAAEKKQGDAAQDSLFAAADEYLQIKPEEVPANEQAKELLEVRDEGAREQQVAEHKSAADDELDAHLAQDSISQQESAYRPTYSASAPRAPAGVHPPMVRAPYRGPARGPRSPARLPPSYITLKGKLTGFNSIISQYPHPAPGYPHQGPRHLPRGAAAGYAAFRDFVRAHASKYKHNLSPQQQYGAAPEPAPAPAPVPVPMRYEQPKSYGPKYAPAAPPASKTYRAPAAKTKVTVAQAYIPQLSSNSNYGQHSVAPYANPVLAKIYGGHAPQGAGKAEYSKDYGMVIHYPQATVYTEPMTVDQLHKLTGAGISQVLEQLQYNLAHGHRDESNTLRANSKHHLGHGITIQAKEYYAPGKAGQYVPTTAAVLSTSSKGGAYGEQHASGEQPAAYTSMGQKPMDLGSGYERVKQAVASSQGKYAGGASASGSARYPSSSEYQAQPEGGEPLSAITNLLGSEIESLYKANSALAKHLEPEIQQAVAKATSYHSKASPLRYTDLTRSPFSAHGLPFAPVAPYSVPRPSHGPRHQRGRGPRRGPHGNRHGPRPYQGPNRPAPHAPRQQAYGQQQAQQGGYQQSQAYQAAEQALNQQVMQLLQDFQSGDDQYNGKNQPLHATNQGYPHKVMQKYQQQQAAYGQAQPAYGQQQQQQQAVYASPPQQQASYGPQQASPYAQHEGLEIPQGANDQIGEIADLIESLKGAIDLNKPDGAEGSYGGASKQPKQEEVRYLASTLGQAPSYALQVPVSGASAYDKKPEGAYQQPAAAGPQSAYAAPAGYQAEQPAPAELGYQQQQQSGYGPQQAAGGYGSAPQQQPQPQQAGYQQGQPQGGEYRPQSYAPSAQQQVAAAAAAAASYGAPAAAGYGAPAASGYSAPAASGYNAPAAAGYGAQAASSYGNPAAPGYGAQAAPSYGAAAAGPSYGAPAAPSSGYQQAGEQPQSYSAHEQAQVIDHLVPAAAPQQSGYEAGQAASAGAAPATQIGLAAPTEAHYQQAQSLSSFVDSLPTDYQEILRQPALLDGHANVSHLAIQEGAAPAAAQYNATSAASAPSSSSTSSHYDSNQSAQQQPQQQSYEQAKPASTGASSSGTQYSAVKK